jgi:fatty-acyl-CoA synthase
MQYHPSFHAQTWPDRPAVIMTGSGDMMTYRELDETSNRFAQLLRARGLEIGDTVALCFENQPMFFALCWGAQRAGLVYVAISNRLAPPEVAYIAQDSGAGLLVGSGLLAPLLDQVAALAPNVPQLRLGGHGALDLAAALAAMPPTPIADERAGCDMLYSSGTTGKPKGVRMPLPEVPDIGDSPSLVKLTIGVFGFSSDTVYLSPAPLYHAAPLRWSMGVQRLGGTVICMEKFDPEKALEAIERYRITASQWVPTHFVRLLKLPDETRSRYDVSSLRAAVHAAAPCPVPVKQAMIAWWGPILLEYYAGTEGNGFTYVSSQEWLERPGSVGRALVGTIRICDEHGNEVPRGTEGQVFFEGGGQFRYHNDPDKTRDATNQHGWTSLGDIGRIDDDGYLYLTDRKSFMIISGGVNIYPQEIENLLITHPKVADVAVIGAPDADMGERVVAVIQPADMAEAGPALAEELAAWLGPQLSRVKLPRQIDFRAELPREPTGKLFKRLLRDEYRAAANAADGMANMA